MVSSTLGSPTMTGWKRRSRAASFSMCLRYSSSVVAPMQRSSPRASAGLSMLAASTAPSAAPAPTSVCSSSMNRMICALGLGDLLEHGLEAVLELAAVLGAGDQRAEVERDHALVLQALGHVAGDDALGQPFDDGGLAHARLADQHRVVLGAPREHLHHAADLLVAADHGIELAGAGDLGEVAAELLERLVLGLGILVGDALAAAHRVDALRDRLGRGAGVAQQAPHVVVAVLREGQQQVLGGDVLVLALLGVLEGRLQHPRERRGEARLGAPRDLGQALEQALERLAQAVLGHAELLEDRYHRALRAGRAGRAAGAPARSGRGRGSRRGTGLRPGLPGPSG